MKTRQSCGANEISTTYFSNNIPTALQIPCTKNDFVVETVAE